MEMKQFSISASCNLIELHLEVFAAFPFLLGTSTSLRYMHAEQGQWMPLSCDRDWRECILSAALQSPANTVYILVSFSSL